MIQQRRITRHTLFYDLMYSTACPASVPLGHVQAGSKHDVSVQ